MEKEAPSDAHIPSHKLMQQHGLISKSSNGIYITLPYGLRALQKLTNIIDEEMQGIGGQKVTMPNLITASLWRKSGRWETAGDELFRLRDRKNSLYCLSPTHEEVVTDLVKNTFTSPKQFPLRIYQITTKFRDEVRPRFGLMRGREFLMKDMYSFDATQADAFNTYEIVKQAYVRIFDRLDVPYMIADADSGSIGGDKSQEFHIISNHGEDILLSCECKQYVSNVEKAKGIIPNLSPDKFTSINKYSGEFNADISNQLLGKPVYLSIQKQDQTIPAVVLLGQNRDVNTFKVKSLADADDVQITTLEQFESTVNINNNFLLFIDESSSTNSKSPSDLTAFYGNNTKIVVGDFRLAKAGDVCPGIDDGNGNNVCPCAKEEQSTSPTLVDRRGIEVGHIFYLGTKYSTPMEATYKNTKGETVTMEMGCYGIGVTRLLASIVESCHDQRGLVWPLAVAPYKIIVIPLNGNDLVEKADEFYDLLQANGFRGEVVLEDRHHFQPGAKMNDAVTLGFPFSVIIGKKMQTEGMIEIQNRKTGEKKYLSAEEGITFLQKAIFS